jgi:hypothetical protein
MVSSHHRSPWPSAIEGLVNVQGLEEVFTPGSKVTVAVVIAILSLIFFFQRFGTKVVGSTFGPVMGVLVQHVGGARSHLRDPIPPMCCGALSPPLCHCAPYGVS